MPAASRAGSTRKTVRAASPNWSSATVALVATKSGTSLTLTGLGITVETNALTRFKNTSLAALSTGNYLRVRGRPGSGNRTIATEIEVQGGGNASRVILQSVAAAVSAPNVTLLGIVADTSPISDNNFKDARDAIIGRTAFFAAAAPGKLIKVRGSLNGNTVTWDQEIELED